MRVIRKLKNDHAFAKDGAFDRLHIFTARQKPAAMPGQSCRRQRRVFPVNLGVMNSHSADEICGHGDLSLLRD